MRITLPNPEKFSNIFESVANITLNKPILGICTDSRECIEGDLFIAIVGEKTDGNTFINNAREGGAVACLVGKKDDSANIQQITVPDPVKFIGKIANVWRKQFDLPVIGITGSNGKTTTKELIKHFLSSKYNVHATKGNFNTSIGVPLTLLLIQDEHDFSIIEMGANQIGDISYLCKIAEPTDGLVTNIAPAHLEGFGSIENVASEKVELLRYISNGKVFINFTDERLNALNLNVETISFGCKSSCAYCADYFREPDGNIVLIVNTIELSLNSKNKIFAKNVLAAAAVANTFGINWYSIEEHIKSFSPTIGRSVITEHNDITIIDDTYNANYNSTIAALEHLSAIPSNGRKIFIFGDMAELGEYSAKYHRMVGKKCKNLVDAVFTIGNETKATDGILNSTIYHKHFHTKNELTNELIEFIRKNDILLFKGSRSMEMEKIIQEVVKD